MRSRTKSSNTALQYGDETSYLLELANLMLSYTTGYAVERSDRRNNAVERRRKLMDACAKFATPLDWPKITMGNKDGKSE